MKSPAASRVAAALALTFALLVPRAAAQQPKPKPPTPNPTTTARAEPATAADIDTLFAADAYAVYGEMRGVGQYVSSEEFTEMFEPLRAPGALPGELLALLDFLTSHAEQLSTSRIAFATLPTAEGLPSVVAAVELASAEDAQKFEPQVRELLAKYIAPPTKAADSEEVTAAATKADAAPRRAAPAAGRANRQRAQQPSRVEASARTARASASKEEAPAPFYTRRSGRLVVMADGQFTFRRLRLAADAPLLAQEPGFAAARARLSGETLFLYFNTARMNRSFRRQVEEMERRQKKAEELARAERAKSGQTDENRIVEADPVLFPPDNRPVSYGPPTTTTSDAGPVAPPPPVEIVVAGPGSNPEAAAGAIPPGVLAQMSAEERAALGVDEQGRPAKPTPEDEERRRVREQQRAFESQLSSLVFSGDPSGGSWPESIGVGAALEGEAIVLRAFLVSDSSQRAQRPVPFIPIMLSGPQLQPEAANVVPAGADVFVSASLDLPQMYDYVASAFQLFDLAAGGAGEGGAKQGLFESQVSAFEKANKFRIREDLINSLGHEIGVCLPGDFLGVRRGRRVRARAATAGAAAAQGEAAPAAQTGPVFIISLNDKEALQKLLPRLLEAAGLKGVTEQQMIQKQGGVEYLTFSQGAVAFIDRFLVVAPDAETMRWVVNAYERRETLGASEQFRAAAGWQPRPLLGHAYVSNALLKEVFADFHQSADDIQDPRLRALIARLDPNPGAVTHALTRDADGLLHELRVPKNLLKLFSVSNLAERELAPMRSNESRALFALHNIVRTQSEYKAAHGAYAGRAELERNIRAELGKEEGGLRLSDYMTNPFETEGYEIKLSASGDKFEATATPTAYRKTGRRSFYVDQTGVVRGADLGGKPADAQTDPVNY